MVRMPPVPLARLFVNTHDRPAGTPSPTATPAETPMGSGPARKGPLGPARSIADLEAAAVAAGAVPAVAL